MLRAPSTPIAILATCSESQLFNAFVLTAEQSFRTIVLDAIPSQSVRHGLLVWANASANNECMFQLQSLRGLGMKQLVNGAA